MASTTRPAHSSGVTDDRTSRVRAEPAPTRGMDRRWALLAMALGFGVVQLDVTAVNVAIRPITAGFGGSVAGGQWVVNAYTLALASLLLLAGALGDRVGATRVFVAGFGLFTLASAACGLAPTLGVLIAARAVQAIGAAVLIPCSLTLLHHTYPDAIERGRAVGIWAACASIALSAGPLIGGVLVQVLNWRAIFYINAPLGLLGILLTLRHAAETPRTPRRLDLPGQALAIVALAALAAALIAAGRDGFANPLVISGLAVASLGGLVFVWVEAGSGEPMLPLGLFRSRTFAATVSIGLMISIAFYGLIFVLSLYFQSVRGYSVLATGAAFAPTTCWGFRWQPARRSVCAPGRAAPRADDIGHADRCQPGGVAGHRRVCRLRHGARPADHTGIRTRCPGTEHDLSAARQRRYHPIRPRLRCPEYCSADRERHRRRVVRSARQRPPDRRIAPEPHGVNSACRPHGRRILRCRLGERRMIDRCALPGSPFGPHHWRP